MQTKTKRTPKKEFYGQIEYIDIRYFEDDCKVVIRTDRQSDNTFICLEIDLHSFLKCFGKNHMTRLKNQLIKNVKSL